MSASWSYQELVARLRSVDNFSFSRFGDGEWNCIFGEPGGNCDGHDYTADLGHALAAVLAAPAPCVLGLQNFAKNRLGMRITAHAPDINWADADVLHRASIKGVLGSFFEALQTRQNILVGPPALRCIREVPYWRFVEIPARNCWRASERVLQELRAALREQSNVVVLFCASMAANVWIHELYEEHVDSHTFVDVGSLLDPYCGINSRAYHGPLALKDSSSPLRSYEEIPGWFNFQDVYEQAVARSSDGAVMVEIGAWMGRSTAYLSALIRDSKKDIELRVVDTWRGNENVRVCSDAIAALGDRDLLNVFLSNMQRLGLRKHVLPVRMDSVAAAATMADQSIDFAFIDADHRYGPVRADIDAWLPKIKPGGVLAGHDYHKAPGVKQAVGEVFGTAFSVSKDSWIAQVV